MKKVVTIGGSSSKNSINKKLAEFVGDQLNKVELIKVDLNDFEMPLFSIDKENEHGFTDATLALDSIIDNADGFIISLAEHNGAYSAAFKNVFDWLSRINGKVWRDKPMLLLSTSPGIRGGKSVLQMALNRFPYNGGAIVGHLSFPSFHDNFVNGKVVDPDLSNELEELVNKLEKSI
jgi:NAD(P)H-dependent FMN reductase